MIEPVYRTVLIPAMGLFGVSFGLWYVGLGLSGGAPLGCFAPGSRLLQVRRRNRRRGERGGDDHERERADAQRCRGGSEGNGSSKTSGPAAIVSAFAVTLVIAITGTALPTCRLLAETIRPAAEPIAITAASGLNTIVAQAHRRAPPRAP